MGYSLKSFIFIIASIFIISIFLVFDLFVHPGSPATFDGPTHVTNIAQVHAALVAGEFPARWGGGFARYGLPAPSIAQQVPSYLGAFLTFFSRNVVISYKVVVFIAAFLSSLLMYLFLRLHVSSRSAFIGAFLFNFAPYRIMNIYIRGALPEFMASVVIISTLISLHLILAQKKFSGYLLLVLSIALLLLTHPFMVVVGSFLFVPYGLYLFFQNSSKDRIKTIVTVGISLLLGLGLASYYIVPLFLEIKYFYYGIGVTHFAEGHFLSLSQFFLERWYYFYEGDIFTRGNVHLGGLVEGITVLAGIVYLAWSIVKKKKFDLVDLWTITAIVVVIFMMPITELLYTRTPLGNIQHPWRMLTAYIVIPPIILALLLEKVRFQISLIFFIVLMIAALRFPQLYGKNYTVYPQDTYYHTDYNLHGVVMDTIWMAEERSYPYQKKKVQILEGTGTINNLAVSNSRREYSIHAGTELKMVDYTFYFPGWKVYVDGQDTVIQFQDPALRGVITYMVPPGDHTVRVVFENTKVRFFGNSLTIVSAIAFAGVIFFRKKLSKFFNKKQ